MFFWNVVQREALENHYVFTQAKVLKSWILGALVDKSHEGDEGL